MAKTIKVIEKNAGKKIGYELDGNTLWIGDAIAMKLQRLQTDDVVKKDICADKDGNLVFGLGENYVAQVEIPNMIISQGSRTARASRQRKRYRKVLMFPSVH